MPPPTLPSEVPLQQMLEARRLALRDRRLAHVIDALRSRADRFETPPRSLMMAITTFSAERSELLRRRAELDA